MQRVAVGAVMLVCFAGGEMSGTLCLREILFSCAAKVAHNSHGDFRLNFSQPALPNRALLAAFMDDAICQYSYLPVSEICRQNHKGRWLTKKFEPLEYATVSCL